jgi:hypothetical protein
MHETGKIFIVLGSIAILVGFILYMGWGNSVFGWMGKLPGDIRIERENSRLYFPIVTCIVLSVLLTIVFQLFFWIRGR